MVKLKLYNKGDEFKTNLIDYNFVESLYPMAAFLENYHNYEIKNFDNIPDSGGIIIGNHGFLAYDMLMLAINFYKKTGKLWRGLTDHVIFKIPILREIFLGLGIVDGEFNTAMKLLNKDQYLIIFPGGAREAMKSSKYRYKLLWEGRYGFIKLALKANKPIIPTISIGIDDVFDVHNDGYKLGSLLGIKDIPIPFATGLHGIPFIPKPVKITHYIGKPIYFSQKERGYIDDKYGLRKLQRKIKSVMENMIITGLKETKRWQ